VRCLCCLSDFQLRDCQWHLHGLPVVRFRPTSQPRLFWLAARRCVWLLCHARAVCCCLASGASQRMSLGSRCCVTWLLDGQHFFCVCGRVCCLQCNLVSPYGCAKLSHSLAARSIMMLISAGAPRSVVWFPVHTYAHWLARGVANVCTRSVGLALRVAGQSAGGDRKGVCSVLERLLVLRPGCMEREKKEHQNQHASLFLWGVVSYI
jgi:hypothetical protein